MCILKISKEKIAKRNIYGYKLLRQGKIIDRNGYSGTLFKTTKNFLYGWFSNIQYNLNVSIIASVQNHKKASLRMNVNNKIPIGIYLFASDEQVRCYGAVICKFKIPKGTKYYLGIDLAGNKIKLAEQVIRIS